MQTIPAFYLLDDRLRTLRTAHAPAPEAGDHRPDDAVVHAARRLAQTQRAGGAMIAHLGDRRIVRLVALDGSVAVRGASYALFVERPAAA
jgi:hypothetical protein